MIGRQVRHNVFGPGTVTGSGDGKIAVEFSGVEKRFRFPEAFGRFLTTEDAELQAMVARTLREKEEEAREKEQEQRNAIKAARVSVSASHKATAADLEPATQTNGSPLRIRGSTGDWIIPCNPKWYDIYGAFRHLKTVDWRQNVKRIEPGDIVYIYSGRPIQAITHKCRVTKVDIPLAEVDTSDLEFDLDPDDGDGSLQPYDRCMRLQLIAEYDPGILPLSKLREYGLVGQIQGQRHTGPHIQAAIDSVDQGDGSAD